MEPREIAARLGLRYQRLEGCSGSDFQKRCKSLIELLNKVQELLAITRILEGILQTDQAITPCLIDSARASRELDSAQFAAVCLHHLKQVARSPGHAEKALSPEQGARSHAYEMFRRRFIEPLVEYFEEELTEGLQILPVLMKYKRLVEWTPNELTVTFRAA